MVQYNPEFNGGLQTIRRVANLIWAAQVARMETESPLDEFRVIDNIFIDVSPYMKEEELKDYNKLYEDCNESLTLENVRKLFIFVRKLEIVQKLTMKHTDELEGLFDD